MAFVRGNILPILKEHRRRPFEGRCLCLGQPHIFHVPNCLANIWAMLGPTGRVIHIAPTSNFVDHGFYMFSPTFFHDYYSANRWELNTIQITQALNATQPDVEPGFYADYEPGLLDALSNGGLDGKAYGTFCVATKVAGSTGSVSPQQGYYTRTAGWDAR